MSRKIKLFLCDDHVLFRKGLKAVFQNDPSIEVVGEAGSGTEAIRRIQQVHPDIVLMDTSMPEMNGFEATQRIVRSSEKPRVLILTLHDEDDFIVRSLEAGASGYILKDAPIDQLFYAVRQAFKGGKYLSPGSPTKVAVEYFQNSLRPKETHHRLGSRQREVLKLLAEGSSVKEIALRLRLKVPAVEACKYGLMLKFHAHDRTELVQYATRENIVRASSEKSSRKQFDGRAA